MFQLCLSRYVLITLCILVLSFEFDFVWSTCDFPVYPVSLPCLVLPCLDVLIKDYYLSLRPRLRVPVPPSCVHRDRSSDLNSKRRPCTLFCFFALKVFILFLFPVCPAAWKSPLVISRHSPLQDGVGVRRDRRESAGHEPSCSPIAGAIRRRRWLFQARRWVT